MRTRRLVGEPLAAAHVTDLVRLHSDPVVMQTMGGSWASSRTEEWIERQIQLQRRWGHGVWLFRLATSGIPVGRGALRHVLIEDEDEVEVGYVVFREFWNQGLATEIASALAELAFDHLGRDNVVAYTTPDNAASKRVMEKAGFAYERDFLDGDARRVLYRRLASVR